MMLNLAGLRISRIYGAGAETNAQDLLWRHHRVESLPGAAAADGPFATVCGEASGEGLRTDFHFGHRGRVRCRFLVGADGRSVESWAIREISERDLLALFGEHILRTVLIRRDLPSFHAASLTDGEGAILIMGGKGMGKSTLSSALQQRGWSSIADDLTRVADAGGQWRAFSGLRNTKLLADSAAALGLRPEGLPPRWDDPGGAGQDKRLVVPAADMPAADRAFRLTALLILQPRRAGEAGLSHRLASPLNAVRGLLDHVTADSLAPAAAPSPALQRALGDLVRCLPVIEVALPDRLDALRASAEAIEAIVACVDARRAA